MPAEEKQSRSEHGTPELACTRCRERKIRCGRERPQCRNCEREGGAICVFQNPVKRVNHLKLLCDSIDQVQDRLTTMELHLARLANSSPRSIDQNQEDASSAHRSRQASLGQHDLDDGSEDDDEEIHTVEATDLHIFRSQMDMVDRYHGPSSLFVLCNRFRVQVLDASNATEHGSWLCEKLQNLCEVSGATESFPSYGDQLLLQLLPKQQVTTAIDHFFRHIDCTTDIFVNSHLRANLERVYSHPIEPKDEAWAICFKTLVLLALGKEISTQARNALFGDFARSFLPSRAALINSSLLTVPRLINVQTLILLSVAAQQFDPHGWAELLFTHACMLARIMGLHHAHPLPHDGGSDEAFERAKVVRSLYSRDKSLCTTRGCISWLPSDECNIATQLSASLQLQSAYSDRFQLAIIQDDIYHLENALSRRSPASSRKFQATVQQIEQQLKRYVQTFAIFDLEAPYAPHHALRPLELLATRILALRHGSEPRLVEQVRSDARASCLLLLIAHGDQDRSVIDAFKDLVCCPAPVSPHPSTLPATEPSAAPFASVLDAFSVPAFFILLEDLFQSTGDEDASRSNADFDLLRKVSACYTNSTAQAWFNGYHQKIALIFSQLLKMIAILKNPQEHKLESVAPQAPLAEMMPSDLSPHMSSFPYQSLDVSNMPTPPPQSDFSNWSFQPTTPISTPLFWDDWLSVPSSFGPPTPSSMGNLADGLGTATPDLLASMLGPSQCLPDSSGRLKQWPATTAEPCIATKRRRIREELDSPP